MKVRWALRGGGRSRHLAWTLSVGAILMASSAAAVEAAPVLEAKDLPKPATTVKDWMAQVEAATVQVTGVSLNRTESGLEIVLQTAGSKLLQVDATQFRTEGNRLIADIPNAVLALPEAQSFSAENPTADIATVQVVQQDAGSIRVTVTGTNALPTSEVALKTGEFAYVLNPGGEEQEPDEEIVATGETEQGYFVPNASVGTKTDTPIRDIPFSVQVVPQQVIQDTQSRRITQAVENVPGVIAQGSGAAFNRDYFNIRGFETYNALINGLPDPQTTNDSTFINVDRIEVLKGSASALYGDSGASSVGGTINYVTLRPLSEPFYEVEGIVGNYNFYQGTVDISGPLNASKSVLGRFIAGYIYDQTFVDFNTAKSVGIAPSLSFQFGSKSNLIVEGDVNIQERGDNFGYPVIGTVLPNPNGKIPLSFNARGPGLPDNTTYVGRVGYFFEHQFSENLILRNAFRYNFGFSPDNGGVNIFPSELEADKRTLNRTAYFGEGFYNYYLIDTNLLSKFRTGPVEHQVLLGFSLSRNTINTENGTVPAPPVDIFNPIFNQNVVPGDITESQFIATNTAGIYIQDLVTLLPNLKLLVGGRFNLFDQRTTDRLAKTETTQSDSAFTPRVGLVYQPIQPVSLYASYTTSFNPVIGVALSGNTLKPERGTQYEIGIKAEPIHRLSMTLALYNLTRTNVTTPNPANPDFSVQSGEQRSRGLEFDISGEILPGWNIIAGYAYTDATVIKDNDIPAGNRLFGAPEHAVNLWTTYRIQRGPAKGLGFGLGLYYLGERPIDNANTVFLPGFVRTDAAIFYERAQFRVALNIRNLFDIENYVSQYGSSSFVSPGTPFTIQGSLSWRF